MSGLYDNPPSLPETQLIFLLFSIITVNLQGRRGPRMYICMYVCKTIKLLYAMCY